MEEDYGKTASGIPITEELIEKLSAKAEAGYDVDAILERWRDVDPSEAADASANGDGPPNQA